MPRVRQRSTVCATRVRELVEIDGDRNLWPLPAEHDGFAQVLDVVGLWEFGVGNELAESGFDHSVSWARLHGTILVGRRTRVARKL